MYVQANVGRVPVNGRRARWRTVRRRALRDPARHDRGCLADRWRDLFQRRPPGECGKITELQAWASAIALRPRPETAATRSIDLDQTIQPAAAFTDEDFIVCGCAPPKWRQCGPFR